MAIARFEISKRSENWRNGMTEFDLDLRFRLTAKSYLFYSSLTLPLQSNSGFLPLRGGGGAAGAPPEAETFAPLKFGPKTIEKLA